MGGQIRDFTTNLLQVEDHLFLSVRLNTLPIWAIVLVLTCEKIAESTGRSRKRGTIR